MAPADSKKKDTNKKVTMYQTYGNFDLFLVKEGRDENREMVTKD
jgi:hypothetical protein